MGKKNLMIIVPTLQCGGQERVAVNTAEIMSADYDVTFVVFDHREAVYAPVCKVIDLAIPAAPSKLAKVKNVLCRAYALYKLKKEKNIDFTLSFGTTANLANVLSGRRGKTIINLRGFDAVNSGFVNHMMYRHSDTIICCAQEMCAALARLNPVYKNKTVCLYNPYQIAQLWEKGGESVTDYSFSAHTIVTQGRLDEVKNYPRLIKAFSLVRQCVSDAQLLMIGDGDMRPTLEALIMQYHLADSVTLLGFRKNPFAYLSKSTAYVLSSYSEGFPNALIEGMAFLPAVSVDCKTGPREILSDGPIDRVTSGFEEADYGVLVQPTVTREFSQELTEDDRVLAAAILSVLTNPDKAKILQEKAKLRVADFSYEAYRVRLQQIFQKEGR